MTKMELKQKTGVRGNLYEYYVKVMVTKSQWPKAALQRVKEPNTHRLTDRRLASGKLFTQFISFKLRKDAYSLLNLFICKYEKQLRRYLQDCSILARERQVWLHRLAIFLAARRSSAPGLDTRGKEASTTAWTRPSHCNSFIC